MLISIILAALLIIVITESVSKIDELKAILTCERNARASREKDIEYLENKIESGRNEIIWSTSWLIKTINKKARATKYISELKKELQVKDKIIENLSNQNSRNKYDIRALADENKNLRILLKIEGER